jgi:ankyrin repeat protein
VEAAGVGRRLAAALVLAALLPGCSNQKSPDEQLILATRRNQPAEVDRLLAAGADPNADKLPGYEGRPALFHAATFGYVDIAGELIQRGANVNYGADRGALTPLLVAALNGPPAMVDLLLRSGAQVNVQAAGATPLTEATRKGDPEVIRLLLDAGADPGVPMSDGTAPVCYAKTHGYHDAAQLLANAGATGAC